MYERIRKENVALFKELKLLIDQFHTLSPSQIDHLKRGLRHLEALGSYEPGQFAILFICCAALSILCVCAPVPHYAAAIFFGAYSVSVFNACIESKKDARIFQKFFKREIERMNYLL